MGRMGSSKMDHAIQQSNLEVVAVCDVYQSHLGSAVEQAREQGHHPRAVHDFREILADQPIGIVNISTPDHWHAYMTVETRKAGQDL